MLRMNCYTKVFPSNALKAKAGISKDYKIECTSIIKNYIYALRQPGQLATARKLQILIFHFCISLPS